MTAEALTAGKASIIGEALVDVVRRPDGTTETHPGGSPANVAIGLGRLGREVALLTSLGADAHGDLVRAHLSGSGVSVAPGSADAPRTSVATATLDGTGAARYEFDHTWAIDGAEPDTSATVVHTGSIAAVLDPGAQAVVEILKQAREHATITYDPNARPALMGDPATVLAAIERVVQLADVVKASDEDLEWLLEGHTDPEIGIAALARDWMSRGGASRGWSSDGWSSGGPALVVVTSGGDGATAYLHDGRSVSVAAPQVEVADTVGAGDSFMSGLIDGLWSAGLLGADRRAALRAIDDATLTRVLDRCAHIGAITVSRAGANPPTRAELDEP